MSRQRRHRRRRWRSAVLVLQCDLLFAGRRPRVAQPREESLQDSLEARESQRLDAAARPDLHGESHAPPTPRARWVTSRAGEQRTLTGTAAKKKLTVFVRFFSLWQTIYLSEVSSILTLTYDKYWLKLQLKKWLNIVVVLKNARSWRVEGKLVNMSERRTVQSPLLSFSNPEYFLPFQDAIESICR